MQLTSTAELGLIPIEFYVSVKAALDYAMALLTGNKVERLYRTKLMIVGYSNVGKTCLLYCLFPLKDTLEVCLFSAGHPRLRYFRPLFVKAQGPLLTIRAGDTENSPVKEVLVIRSQQWQLNPEPDPETRIITLRHTGAVAKGQRSKLRLRCPNDALFTAWVARLKAMCVNRSTHGIDIQTFRESNAITAEYFKQRGESMSRELELSVWDFAGQQEYYENHHHFLTTRTVFVVMWKMSEGEKGLAGLEFWFKSIAMNVNVASTQAKEKAKPAHRLSVVPANHLAPQTSPSSSSTQMAPIQEEGAPQQAIAPKTAEKYHSVIVVGTHLDHEDVKPELRNEREQRARALAKSCGLDVDFVYHEASCVKMTNIDSVSASIFQEALSHSYMGEGIPESYLNVAKVIAQKNQEKADKKEMQVMFTKELEDVIGVPEALPTALELLTLWGNCLHYPDPKELSEIVILDPRFLTKGILADLLTPDPQTNEMRKKGIVERNDLIHIWKGYREENMKDEEFNERCDKFVSLLAKLGVCFPLPPKPGTPPEEHLFIIPSLLPENAIHSDYSTNEWDPTKRKFRTLWPKDPQHPRKIQLERVLKFNVVPGELVSRLLVHVHDKIDDGMVAKNEVLLRDKHKDTQAWILVETGDINRFVVRIRGKTLEACVNFLTWVIEQVTDLGKKYPSGMAVIQQCVRSPHDEDTDIDLELLEEEAKLPVDKRKLCCPSTHFPIFAEESLLRAGLRDKLPLPPDGPQYWNLTPGKLNKGEKILRPLVKNGAKERSANQGDFDKFTKMCELLGCKVGEVTMAYVIANPHLNIGFTEFQRSTNRKHRENEGLFKRRNWKKKQNFQRREGYMARFANQVNNYRYEMNDGRRTPVVPMVQGTSENAAVSILSSGFGITATTDQGYYGRGIYFTSSMKYAAKYATPKAGFGKVFLITAVAPGNVYPVTEPAVLLDVEAKFDRERGARTNAKDGSLLNIPYSLLGKACQAGYQSHYVIVDDKGQPARRPAEKDATDTFLREAADELVVFDTSQALPMFLVYTKEFDNVALSDNPVNDASKDEAVANLTELLIPDTDGWDDGDLDDNKKYLQRENNRLETQVQDLMAHARDQDQHIRERNDKVGKLESQLNTAASKITELEQELSKARKEADKKAEEAKLHQKRLEEAREQQRRLEEARQKQILEEERRRRQQQQQQQAQQQQAQQGEVEKHEGEQPEEEKQEDGQVPESQRPWRKEADNKEQKGQAENSNEKKTGSGRGKIPQIERPGQGRAFGRLNPLFGSKKEPQKPPQQKIEKEKKVEQEVEADLEI